MEPTVTITQNTARGIPPRVCSLPRAKKKPVPNKVGKTLKCHASESEDEKAENMDSDTSVPKVMKRRSDKWQQIEEPKEEEEIIDKNVEPLI